MVILEHFEVTGFIIGKEFQKNKNAEENDH